MNGTLINDMFSGRELFIYLPPSYQSGRKRYPALYVHDRGDLFDPGFSDSLERIEHFCERGEMPELILIGVASADRENEYTPFRQPHVKKTDHIYGGNGALYAAFLAKQLKPFIDRSYPTDGSRENTGIIGKSFGGLISMYTACLHPETFGKIGSLSGSFWFQGITEYMRSQSFENANLRIYMDVGSTEGTDRENLQKEMIPRTKEAFRILIENGVSPEDLKFVIDEGGAHRLERFTKRFPEAVKWLFAGS
ncbi:alpha/beta hydrolase-fold protein [Bacillus sonorensis]|uniref:Esterase n=2 Tax=Bacillus sonorensis TaxID=119858 RepID=M5P3E1_9BACI|nr:MULTISPECIES: alpha/beta hydrolase-fold protein [Bacillus]TWK75400.1 Carbohydrate acetyl esterase/feruloyl esterase [Bacillus paralicheniformis]EME73934.1 esterase [Bacillus sonorensis L12]MBG9913397.1 esterase [Bacillus sonorensis]MCF7619900.1 alpha/beta hydrolase [Bacillus sonorensis]MCY8027634.1 alpha/beta hydrolase-fold protein [Bacillus sonorensis]